MECAPLKNYMNHPAPQGALKGEGETGTNPQSSWSRAAKAPGSAQGRDGQEEAAELDVRSWNIKPQ